MQFHAEHLSAGDGASLIVTKAHHMEEVEGRTGKDNRNVWNGVELRDVSCFDWCSSKR